MNMIQDFPESSKFFESFEIFYQRTPHWNGVLNGKVLKTKYDDRRLQIKFDNASICKKKDLIEENIIQMDPWSPFRSFRESSMIKIDSCETSADYDFFSETVAVRQCTWTCRESERDKLRRNTKSS